MHGLESLQGQPMIAVLSSNKSTNVLGMFNSARYMAWFYDNIQVRIEIVLSRGLVRMVFGAEWNDGCFLSCRRLATSEISVSPNSVHRTR